MMTNNKIIERITHYVSRNDFVYDSTDSRWYTYTDVWRRACTIADYLKERHETYVIAVMNNSINLLVLYFACMVSQSVIVPIDPQKAQKEINSILAEYPKYYLLDDKNYLFDLQSVDISLEDIIERIMEINLNRVYMITYTSGSTGHAKGVVHNLRSLFLSAIAFGKATGLNQSNVMAHVMPMTYMAGILNTIIMPFFCGTKIVLLHRFDVMSAVKFWGNVEKFAINAFWMSPTMLNILMTVDRRGKAREYLSRNATLFFVGTAPLLESTRERFESKYGVKLFQSYGLSETLFISTEQPSKKNDSKSVGYILPGVKIDINQQGEIAIDVPWMFIGYSNEDVKSYFYNGKYKTGDLGRIDNEKRLYITGRIKDLIIKGGMNISPAQIEECLTKSDQIVECAVAGVTIRDEENVFCWYVPRQGKAISTMEFNKMIEDELGQHCKVDVFKQVADIPKNLNGKIDKKKLVKEYNL